MGNMLVVVFLIAYLADVESFAFFLEVSEMDSQLIYLQLIFLLTNQLNLQIFLMFLQLFLYNTSVSNQTSSRHIILILQIKNLFFQLINFSLNLTLLLNDLMKLSAFLQRLKLFYLFIIIVDNLFIIRYFSLKDLLFGGLRLQTLTFLSFLLLLLQIYVDYFLKLLQYFQQLFMFPQQFFLVHILIFLSIFDVLHHDQLASNVDLIALHILMMRKRSFHFSGLLLR